MPNRDQPLDDLQLLRNAFRDPLHPLEEARILARLMKQSGIKTQRELARLVGISQARISQRLALLKMPREVVKLLALPEGLTERHARCIRRLPDPKLQAWLAVRVAKDSLTVDATDDIVNGMLEELGVTSSRSHVGWSQAPGLRWRRHDGWLELQIRGATHAHQLRGAKRFLKLFRQEPRDS